MLQPHQCDRDWRNHKAILHPPLVICCQNSKDDLFLLLQVLTRRIWSLAEQSPGNAGSAICQVVFLPGCAKFPASSETEESCYLLNSVADYWMLCDRRLSPSLMTSPARSPKALLKTNNHLSFVEVAERPLKSKAELEQANRQNLPGLADAQSVTDDAHTLAMEKKL